MITLGTKVISQNFRKMADITDAESRLENETKLKPVKKVIRPNPNIENAKMKLPKKRFLKYSFHSTVLIVRLIRLV